MVSTVKEHKSGLQGEGTPKILPLYSLGIQNRLFDIMILDIQVRVSSPRMDAFHHRKRSLGLSGQFRG